MGAGRGARSTLSVVIPALNEEEAIGSTIERCLAASRIICEKADLKAVEFLVVSDGSTDRTEAIACAYPEVTVLAFERNRGYGAAIMCGFAHARGELLGFMDADGTCDPESFAGLCQALREQQADVALGSRTGQGSEMPWVRMVGNTVFALILGVLSKRRVADTASGMRVIRRDRLDALYPLPDGLHFTPAMSARVLLEDRLKLIEVPMAYAERVGRSKLSALRDGLRFLDVIIKAAMAFRPARLLLAIAGALALGAGALVVEPAAHYLRATRVEEWMIYRLMLASLLATGTALCMSAAVVAERIAALAHGRASAQSGITGAVATLFTRRARRIGLFALGAAALFLVGPGVAEYATKGEISMHWSRALVAGLLLSFAGVLAVTAFLLNMLELIQRQRAPSFVPEPPDRLRLGNP